MKKLFFVMLAVFVTLVLGFAESAGSSYAPQIVAVKSFTKRTKPFSQTLYTPGAEGEGMYRISIYVEMFGATNTTYLTSVVTWTDDVGSVTLTNQPNPPLECGFTGLVARCDVVGIVRAEANTPIRIDFANMVLSQGGSYNAYVVLERLD